MGKKMQLLYFSSSSPSYSSDSYCVPILGQQFTITWDEPPLSMGELVDAYLVNISSPNFLCLNVNTLQKLGSSSGWTMPNWSEGISSQCKQPTVAET